jgi:hypothetical protein
MYREYNIGPIQKNNTPRIKGIVNNQPSRRSIRRRPEERRFVANPAAGPEVLGLSVTALA